MPLPYNSQPIAQTHIMLPLLLLITGVPPSQSIDRNIGIQFTAAPESSVVPPGDLVLFACKTNIGKGEKFHNLPWLCSFIVLQLFVWICFIFHNFKNLLTIFTVLKSREYQNGLLTSFCL